MLHRIRDRQSGTANRFVVSDRCWPQTIDVIRGRAEPLGLEIDVEEVLETPIDDRTFGVLLQYPGVDGEVVDYARLIGRAHDAGAGVAVATDLLALTLLQPPGEQGADVVVGSAQRFGVPMGYGGPHAAFFATRQAHVRQMPGRIIGVSVDSPGAAGVSHGSPDPRAAHPPRARDLEHLHGAGAAGKHRRFLCGLSRARRPQVDCRAGPRSRAGPGPRARPLGAHAAAHGLLRYGVCGGVGTGPRREDPAGSRSRRVEPPLYRHQPHRDRP